MKPYKCPICDGKGIVSGGFYKSVNEYCSTTNMTETCQQCGGGGIIWGNEDSLEPCDGCAPKVKAISPVSREQVEEAWRGEWVPAESDFDDDDTLFDVEDWCDWQCSACHNEICYDDPMERKWLPKFCPNCGAPMTDEAVEMAMERLEALHENRD